VIFEPLERLRWPRSRRFVLSAKGVVAEVAYREDIIASRAVSGRESFDAARSAWAVQFGLKADDGLYLSEVAVTPATLSQIVASLDTCGKSRRDAIAALGRLDDAGMITAPA
jgi:hypothetical protein